MIVKDINLKISIVLQYTDYTPQIIEIHEKYADASKGAVLISEIVDFIRTIELDPMAIGQIFDTNLYDFEWLFHNKEIDDNQLMIQSLEGIQNFPEFTRFEPSRLFNNPELDFSLLLECDKLRIIDASALLFDVNKHKVIEQLKIRGIEVIYQPFDLSFLKTITGKKFQENIKFLHQNPHSSFYWMDLGEMLQEIKEYKLALQCFTNSFDLDIDKLICYHMGSINIELQQYDNAIIFLKLGLETEDEYGDEYIPMINGMLGIALAKTGDIDEAFACFKSSLEEEPIGKTYLNYARLLLETGNIQTAYNNCIKAIYHGEDKLSYLLKGHCHSINGDEKNALQSYAYAKRALKKEFEEEFLHSIEFLTNYTINFEQYLGKIDAIKLPKFNLLEVPAQLKYARYEHLDDLSNENREVLQQHFIPDAYIDWLTASNTAYNTDTMLHHQVDYNSVKLKNFQTLLASIDGTVSHFDYLTKQGYRVFAKSQSDEVIVFDKAGQVYVLKQEVFEASKKSDKKLVNADFHNKYPSFEAFMTKEHLPYILPQAFNAKKLLKDERDHHIVRYLEKLIEDPTDPLWWYNLCVSYHRVGKHELGIITGTHYMYFKTDPSVELKHHDGLFDLLGIMCVYTKRPIVAERYYKKAIELNPKKAVTWSNLGRTYMRSGRKDEAIDAFKKCVEIDPQETQAYMTLGFHLIAMNRPQEALHYANEGVKYGNITNSYLNKGHVHLIDGDEALAIECYAYSKRAFETEEGFWDDFDGDFELLPQYGFILEYYNSLKEKIDPVMKKLPPLKLNELAGLWSKYDRDKYKEFDDADMEFIDSVQIPQVYKDWLAIKNESYESNLHQVSCIDFSVELYNMDGLRHANWDNRRFLHQNGYFVFGENQDGDYYVFNTNNNNEISMISSGTSYSLHNIYSEYRELMLEGKIKNEDIIKADKIDHSETLYYAFWDYEEEDFIPSTKYVKNYIEQRILTNERYDNFLEFLEINYKKANAYLR